MATAITNVRVFDGEAVLHGKVVVIEGQTIQGIDIAIPANATTVDGTGMTLLPGLIDAHTHTKQAYLKLALTFGITTELEMAGYWRPEQRKTIAEDDSMADLRSADFGMTAPGGHPSELLAGLPPHIQFGESPSDTQDAPGHAHAHAPQSVEPPTVRSTADATSFVADRVAAGADYIKFMIEEGSVLESPGLPQLANETLVAGVEAAHAHGKLAIAHALTQEATVQALHVGMDGLAHLFLDGPATDEIVRLFQATGAFVTPCACINASTFGIKPTSLLTDPRVMSRLPEEWRATLDSCTGHYPQGDMQHVFGSIKTLHDAGIDLLVGTDANYPVPKLGGLAHGASVHHELQLFVEAGLTPVEALKAATSLTARRFGLSDRGRIAPGLRADLLLVEGDPTTDIRETLNIKGVWRRGKQLEA